MDLTKLLSSSQSFPAIFLTVSLVVGSLINNFPDGSAFVNVTDFVKNCSLISTATNFVAAVKNDDSSKEENNSLMVVALVLALSLPVCFDLLKLLFPVSTTNNAITTAAAAAAAVDNIMQHPSKKNVLQSIYKHFSGQVLGFSSGEFLRHFLMFPQTEDFVKTCNLTSENCNNAFKNNSTTLNTLCSETSFDQKDIFNSLHTLPNISFVLLGASAVSLIVSYIVSKQQQQQQQQQQFLPTPKVSFQLQPLLKNNKKKQNLPPTHEDETTTTTTTIAVATEEEEAAVVKNNNNNNKTILKCCTLQYFKFSLLIIYICTVFFYVWHSLNVHKLTEMMLSFVHGMLIQTCVHYASFSKKPPTAVVL